MAWSSYDNTRTGVLPDPRSSPVATEHVVRGRVIRGSRAEVDTIVVPDGPERTGQVGLALDAELARVGQRRAAGAASCSWEPLERVLGAVARAVDGPDELLEVAVVAVLGGLSGVGAWCEDGLSR